MKRLLTIFPAIAVLILFASCENATRSLIDKDTAGTDIPVITDADQVAQTDNATTDDITGDGLINDETTTDDIQNDDIQPDGQQPDGQQNDNAQNDNAQPDNVVTPDNDVPALTCADITCTDPNSHCEEGTGGADAECVCNEGYHWNTGQCVSDAPTITGTFSFDFTGIINETTDPMSLQKGTGTVNFSHLGDDITYAPISAPYGNIGFPMANLQQGTTIAVVWLEGLTMSGTVKTFIFMMPVTENTAGTKQMATTQTTAMYGDMAVSSGSMNIDCIRAVSPEGSYTVAGDSGNGSLHITTASGTLYDPAIAGTNLPAPICEE